jgi:hypothetical protein
MSGKEVDEQILNLPPAPEGETFIGSTRDFTNEPLDFFEKYIPKFGDIFQLKSIFFRFISEFERVVIVSNPDMVKHITQDNNRNYVKSFGYRVLKVLLRESLLTTKAILAQATKVNSAWFS